MNIDEEKNDKKRTLKKVRKQVVNKVFGSRIIANISITPEQVDNTNFRMIDPAIGIVEKNHKICAGVRFLNTHVRVDSVIMESKHGSDAITLMLRPNQCGPKLPWEYMMKRLESCGDLDLVTWAQKIKTHHTNYSKTMDQYYKLLESNDPETLAKLEQAKAKALKAYHDIETNYPYKKVTLLSKRDGTMPIVATYSKGFLKEMGHTLEGFIDWAKSNGIPTLFPGDSPFHLEIAKTFLDCSMFQGDPVKESLDYETFIYDKNGETHKASLQLSLILEPGPEGIFVSGYVLMKDKKCQDFKKKCFKAIKKSFNEEEISHIIQVQNDFMKEDSAEKLNGES